jgi:predicted Zn-dependent protease with MMP-like domain
MNQEAFEEIVQSTFDLLPEKFRDAVDNVAILVEDYPSDDLVARMNLPSRHHLLGLYTGVPLPLRGTFYGSSPVVPDRIFLYRKNIEAAARTEAGLRDKIHEVLVHEIGHYLGMNEQEIRAAGF